MREKRVAGETVRTPQDGNRWEVQGEESLGLELLVWWVQDVRAGGKRDGRAKGRQKAEGMTSPTLRLLSPSSLWRVRRES